jgi:hypothetical protein
MVQNDRQIAVDCATLLNEFSRLRLQVDLLAEHGPDTERLTHLIRRLIADEMARAREAGPAWRRPTRRGAT